VSSIGDAVEEFLASKPKETPVRDRITVNLDQVRHYQLERIAERMDMTKAMAAGWLLSMAVKDAADRIGYHQPIDGDDTEMDPEEAAEFWKGFDAWVVRHARASDKGVS